MSDAPNRSALCAIVVTYHPDADCAARVATVARGLGVIVVDNGSTTQELKPLTDIADGSRIELIRHLKNLGVATALNRGVQRAIERGFRWVLLLDQDTDLREGTVTALLAIAAAHPAPKELAVIGARFDDPLQRNSAPIAEAPPDAAWEEVEAVITSGSLLSLTAYQCLGPFRDDFFIDYVDLEYCVRARRAGYRILRSKQTLIDHAVGRPREGRFLWLRKWTTHHSPDRRYYIARNDTVMLRDSGQYPRGRWVLKSAARRLQTCKRIVLFEERKLAKVAASVQGWWAGCRGHMGPRPGSG